MPVFLQIACILKPPTWLTLNGISMILWTGTTTKIFSSAMHHTTIFFIKDYQNSDLLVFTSDQLVFTQLCNQHSTIKLFRQPIFTSKTYNHAVNYNHVSADGNLRIYDRSVYLMNRSELQKKKVEAFNIWDKELLLVLENLPEDDDSLNLQNVFSNKAIEKEEIKERVETSKQKAADIDLSSIWSELVQDNKHLNYKLTISPPMC